MCVIHGLSRSSWVLAPYGLPQGSVLGPLLDIIYTSDIASLLASQAMLGQLYADDVQAYQHCLASDALVTLSAMSWTMEALGSWMSSNRLRLNPHTMQFIWLGTRQQLAKLDMVALICLSSFYFLLNSPRPWCHLGSGTHPCSPHPLALSCLLLPAPSTSRSFPVTYQYCRSHPCPFLCHFQARLLQFPLHWSPCYSPELPRSRSALCRPSNWSGI